MIMKNVQLMINKIRDKKILRRINIKLRKIKDKIEVLFRLMLLSGNTIFLFGYPVHPNMGDQAQAYCIEKWLKYNYPDYNIFTFNWTISHSFALKLLKMVIGRDDLIFGHSGYFMVDHHLELPVYLKIAELFKDYKIVILPQTINFFKKEIENLVAATFNAHPNLTLLCRDEVSYKKAQILFPNCKLLLYPDIVTTLIGTKKFTSKREGILFCVRNDIEAYYKRQEIYQLRERFKGLAPTEVTDTSIEVPYQTIKIRREQLFYEMLEEFSHYKVVITDRYHGTIFSLIVATPVIVLSSADHKLSSGVKWFPENYSRYIKFANNLDEAYSTAIIMYNDKYDYQLPPYFQDIYYSVLKEKLQ